MTWPPSTELITTVAGVMVALSVIWKMVGKPMFDAAKLFILRAINVVNYLEREIPNGDETPEERALSTRALLRSLVKANAETIRVVSMRLDAHMTEMLPIIEEHHRIVQDVAMLRDGPKP